MRLFSKWLFPLLIVMNPLVALPQQLFVDLFLPFDFCKNTPKKEQLAHECGVAFVRLRKPISYYAEKYNDPAWGVKKILSLMEKQRNRGQDGAGISVVKFNTPPGYEYMHRFRAAGENALEGVLRKVILDVEGLNTSSDQLQDENAWKRSSSFLGEVLLGHLRYATHSGFDAKFCQPFVYHHSMACKHFALAGNFNMTNTSDLFKQLQDWGLSPTSESDTQVVLETLGYYLDQEYASLIQQAKDDGLDPMQQHIDLLSVLRRAASSWDGGYVFCGIFGNGDAFICRDPAGIRPGYCYVGEEVIAAASERAALMEVFDLDAKEVFSIKPGSILIIKRDGQIVENIFKDPLLERQCVFERIYFSKGTDPQIYRERKALGEQLAARVYQAIEGDLSHTIFTYVPNSSISAFQGLIEGITHLSRQESIQCLQTHLADRSLDSTQIKNCLEKTVRTEHLVTKNQKLRTFINSDQTRNNLVAQLYEVTKGVVGPEDTLVVIDDSIVRGVTFRESLIKKLIRLNPKKIIIVSSSPPIMYPDCYGIDMSQLGRLVAFQAAVALLKERNESFLLDEVKNRCGKQGGNALEKLYGRFELDEVSEKVAQLLTPVATSWKGSVQVIYQSIEGLHKAIPDFTGDWYFTGNYPTPGGYKVLDTSYLNWYDGIDRRSY